MYRAHDACIGKDTSRLSPRRFCSHQIEPPHFTVKIRALNAEDAGRFLAGVRRRLPLADAANVRVYGPGGAFLGSAHVAGGELIADRLLSPVEVDGALPAPPATRPRIEESESLPS